MIFEKNGSNKPKKRKRISAHAVRFPSDSLTPEQLAALNGPVVVIQTAKKHLNA